MDEPSRNKLREENMMRVILHLGERSDLAGRFVPPQLSSLGRSYMCSTVADTFPRLQLSAAKYEIPHSRYAVNCIDSHVFAASIDGCLRRADGNVRSIFAGRHHRQAIVQRQKPRDDREKLYRRRMAVFETQRMWGSSYR